MDGWPPLTSDILASHESVVATLYIFRWSLIRRHGCLNCAISCSLHDLVSISHPPIPLLFCLTAVFSTIVFLRS